MTRNPRSALTRLLLLTVFLLAVLLVGCSGPELTLEPTLDQQPTFDAIQTQAALTVVAELTRSAPTATEIPTETPVIPTDTPVPTSTPQPATETPTVTATATRVPVILAPTITQTPTLAAYQCAIVESAPASGAEVDKSAEFDARWKLKNTGTQAWQQESVDIKYISGEKMQKYGDLFDLAENVNPDGTISFAIDMIAPTTSGRSTATWALVDGSTTICTLTVNILVK